ncbi:MAG: hypothetical protein ACRED0_10110 [Gammaproteobacteria bacterium]
MASALLSFLSLLGVGNVLAQDPQPLPVSKGVYRLPYVNGTDVRFSNDHTNHPNTLNRLDMTGQGNGPLTVVSAGPGRIRLIVEDNDTTCPNHPNNMNNHDLDGDGTTTPRENQQVQQAACGNYNGPSTFCCERDFEAIGGNCPGTGTCLNVNVPNNFVWIEHPNGEWISAAALDRVRTTTATRGRAASRASSCQRVKRASAIPIRQQLAKLSPAATVGEL